MKILYQTVSDPSAVLDKEGTKLDELHLPDYVLPVLLTDLNNSTDMMPRPARKLQGWDVGLLERQDQDQEYENW